MKNGSTQSGVSARCANCKLSVQVLETPAPVVCPFCHEAMVHTPIEMPEPERVEVEDDVEDHVRRLYRKPPRWLV
jgi:hypothetical protein